MFDKQAFLFPGEVMILGYDVEAVMHRHLALQMTVSLGLPIEVDYGDRSVVEPSGFVIPSLVPHAVMSKEPRAVFFLDPSTRAARQHAHAPGTPTLAEQQGFNREIRTFAGKAGSWVEASAIASKWKSTWLSDAERACFTDERIDDTLDYLEMLRSSYPDRQHLSERVSLSPSRFAALFTAQVGISLRRYLVWRRVGLAVKLMSEGGNVTEAAHESGFSDASHMSRTFTETFGVSPSVFAKMRCSVSFKYPLVSASRSGVR